MDGNGRWAQRRGKPRIYGHRKGVETVRRIVDACGARNIPYLTLYAFSSENWSRPKEEVRLLTELLFTTLKNEAHSLHENGIQLRVIGDLKPFGKRIDKSVCEIEELTRENANLVLTLAVNYGGRWDILQACRQLVAITQDNPDREFNIDETIFESKLSTGNLPNPDLFIRTGGEIRLSNFLLWQTAYAELFFTETLWPEFDEDCLDQALISYKKRQRRFGNVRETVSND